jgi:hypothetical protein
MSPDQIKDAKEAVDEAFDYLRQCGIRLPRFRVTVEAGIVGLGGSFVSGTGRALRLNMGYYPTTFLRQWFAMHELGHVLWRHHKPLRWKRFRQEFGEPCPRNYEEIHKKYSAITAVSSKLSWYPGPHRPKGQSSWYGNYGGGEERFCELIGLMWANKDFSAEPPSDLTELWDACWNHGLARMT